MEKFSMSTGWHHQLESLTTFDPEDKDLNSNVSLIYVFLILSVLSFVPQFWRTFSRRSSAGLSIGYVLLNLMAATEHFAYVLLVYIDHVDDDNDFAYNPRTTGDLINLIQLGLLFVCFAVLFIARIIFPPEDRELPPQVAISVYILWLALAFLPGMYCLYNQSSSTAPWGLAPYVILHSLILAPLVTIASFASLAPQANLLCSRSDTGVISMTGLAVQTTVFALNALFWLRRVAFDWDGWSKENDGLGLMWMWYATVGFVAIDTGIFAVVQGVLLVIASHQRGSRRNPETEPLLASP